MNDIDTRNENPVGGPVTGLCAACDHASYCVHARVSTRPAVQCEQFQFELVVPDIHDGPRLAASRWRRDGPAPREGGLCGYCASNSTCSFPRTPAGAWFCEEYR
jgi:hypothetical protein